MAGPLIMEPIEKFVNPDGSFTDYCIDIFIARARATLRQMLKDTRLKRREAQVTVNYDIIIKIPESVREGFPP